MQTILIALAILAFLSSSCKKETASTEQPPVDPVTKPVGDVIGAKITKMIGAAGGTIASADQSLKVTVPAGAVNADTEFSLQEIVNTCSGGVGKSFALTPHGVNFQKPVEIEFAYTEDAGVSVPDVLAIAYQDARGVWKLANNNSHDKAAKKIHVETTHFSNWTLMEWLQLKPVKATLAPGASLDLQVMSYIPITDDLLVPLVPPPGTEIGVGEGHLLQASFIKEWKLVGVGSLNGKGAVAKYGAPASLAGVATATATATLRDAKSQLILLSNITVVGEGIMYRIGGGEWQHLPGWAMKGSDNYNLGGQADGKYMAIDWPGGAGNFAWLHNPDEDKGEKAIGFFYTDGTGRNYKSTYFENDIFFDSGGSLNVEKFGAVGTFVAGSLTISRSAYYYGDDDTKEAGRTTVEAHFRLKRSR